MHLYKYLTLYSWYYGDNGGSGILGIHIFEGLVINKQWRPLVSNVYKSLKSRKTLWHSQGGSVTTLKEQFGERQIHFPVEFNEETDTIPLICLLWQL